MAVQTYPVPNWELDDPSKPWHHGAGIPAATPKAPSMNLLSLAGPLLGGLFSASGARRQNKLARQMAREQMAFQERMSSTAHQRQVKDLRAAGLNPILSALGGASSPGGAMAPQVDELGPAVNSAIALRRQQADLKLLKAQTAQVNNQAEKTRLEQAQVEATTRQIEAGLPKRELFEGLWQILDDAMPNSGADLRRKLEEKPILRVTPPKKKLKWWEGWIPKFKLKSKKDLGR